jgi:glucose/mannose transport system permease protein
MAGSTSGGNFDVPGLVDGINVRRLGIYVLVIFFIAFFLAPLETGLMTAFKSNEAVARSLPIAPPTGEGFTLDNMQFALGKLSGSFFNSLIMAIPATIGSVLLGSMAAYGLTLVDWRGQVGVLVLFLIGIFVPYQAVLVPLARFWNNIFPIARMVAPTFEALPFLAAYHANLVPLTITHIAYGIPICTILFRSYYVSLPDSLIEAAKIDGAGFAKIYRRIVLPVSLPMFGVVFIYQFTQIYNEFLFAFTLVVGADAPAAPVTLVLPAIGASTSGIDFGVRMSASLLAALPTLILYVAFAEQFAKGLRTESG